MSGRFSSLTENVQLKLFSLAMATLLFLIVNVENQAAVVLDFPVEYSLRDGMMIVGTAPTVAHVTVQGPWARFRQFAREDLQSLKVDLTAAGPGWSNVRLELDDVAPPVGMHLVSLRPAEVAVHLDRRAEREVPVSIDVTGKTAFGYRVADMVAAPPQARVVGPGTKVRGIDFVHTDPVELSGREESFTVKVLTRAPPSPVRVLDPEVEVRVTVVEEYTERVLTLPVVLEGAPEGFALAVDSVMLEVSGPRRLVDPLDDTERQAVVDGADLRAGHTGAIERGIQVRPALPERVKAKGALPKLNVIIPKRGRRP